MLEPVSTVSVLPVEPVILIATVPVVVMTPALSMLDEPEPTRRIALAVATFPVPAIVPVLVIVVEVSLNDTTPISAPEMVPALLIVAISFPPPPLPPAKTPTDAKVVFVSVAVMLPPARLMTFNVPSDSTAVPVVPVPPSADTFPEFVRASDCTANTPSVPFALEPEAEIVPVLVKSMASD
jgi:hypothetical protein